MKKTWCLKVGLTNSGADNQLNIHHFIDLAISDARIKVTHPSAFLEFFFLNILIIFLNLIAIYMYNTAFNKIGTLAQYSFDKTKIFQSELLCILSTFKHSIQIIHHSCANNYTVLFDAWSH